MHIEHPAWYVHVHTHTLHILSQGHEHTKNKTHSPDIIHTLWREDVCCPTTLCVLLEEETFCSWATTQHSPDVAQPSTIPCTPHSKLDVRHPPTSATPPGSLLNETNPRWNCAAPPGDVPCLPAKNAGRRRPWLVLLRFWPTQILGLPAGVLRRRLQHEDLQVFLPPFSGPKLGLAKNSCTSTRRRASPRFR